MNTPVVDTSVQWDSPLLGLVIAPTALLAGLQEPDENIVVKSAEVRKLLLAADQTVQRIVELDTASSMSDPQIEDSRRAAGEDDSFALEQARQRVEELALLQAASLRGIAAKAAIFRPPLAFRVDDPEHVMLAATILRDLGCSVEGQP